MWTFAFSFVGVGLWVSGLPTLGGMCLGMGLADFFHRELAAERGLRRLLRQSKRAQAPAVAAKGGRGAN